MLLDILMPDMTGYDVCRRIREDPATRLLPVVMLTSSGDQDKVNAIEAGADDFIGRPFNPQELLSRVRSLLADQGISRHDPDADRRARRVEPDPGGACRMSSSGSSRASIAYAGISRRRSRT